MSIELVNHQFKNSKLTNMARKRSLVILPKLKNCGGDLSKKWYVEYSCRDPQTNEMKRFRHYDGFAELDTVQKREDHAKKIISEIKLKLEKGTILLARGK